MWDPMYPLLSLDFGPDRCGTNNLGTDTDVFRIILLGLGEGFKSLSVLYHIILLLTLYQQNPAMQLISL